MAQPSAGSPQVVRCEFRDSEFCRMFFNNVPHNLFSYFLSPCGSISTDTSEELTNCDPCSCRPSVNRLLYPVRHRHGTDVPSFTDEVNNGPMFLPTLKVIEGQINKLAAA